MKHTTRLIFVLALVVMIFCMAACGSTETPVASNDGKQETADAPQPSGAGALTNIANPEAEYTIGFSIADYDHPYNVAKYNEFLAAVEELAPDWSVQAVDAQNDYAKQANDVDDLVAAGVDGIVITPGDSTSSAESAKAARAAGVLVVCIDRGYDDSESYDVWVAGDNIFIGTQTAEKIAELSLIHI